MTRDQIKAEDDDMGALWREHAAARQVKRADNREASASMLRDAGIPFVSKNEGAHLIVRNDIDFWPGTGLWRVRGSTQRHRGVSKLLKFCKDIKCPLTNQSTGVKSMGTFTTKLKLGGKA